MSDGQKRNTSLRIFLLGRHLPLETETAYFILLNVLDLGVTYLLLTRGGFRELNGLAAFLWQRWQLPGLIVFKLTLVASVAVVCQAIALKNEGTARKILNFGTILVVLVVLYSLTLLVPELLP